MTDASTQKFLNARDWQSFLTAVQSSMSYPKMIDALRGSPSWFVDGAARTSNWLLSSGLFRPTSYF